MILCLGTFLGHPVYRLSYITAYCTAFKSFLFHVWKW